MKLVDYIFSMKGICQNSGNLLNVKIKAAITFFQKKKNINPKIPKFSKYILTDIRMK